MLSRQFAAKLGSQTKFVAGSIKRDIGSVCILAGYPSQDYKGAQIMRDLKEKYGNRVTFFGVGGQEMEAEGLENLGSINKFIDKPFYTWKNGHPFHRERCYVPYMIGTRFTNKQVLKEVSVDFGSKAARLSRIKMEV